MSTFTGGYRGSRSRGRGSTYRGSNSRGGRYAQGGRGPATGRGAGRGHGGDTITFSVCKFYVSGTCNRGDNCHHRHAVRRVSEEQVSAQRPSDGSRGAIRSLVQWKEKPDHIFTACDDGTVKMWTTADGSTWTQVTSVGLHEWRHIGALHEADGVLYVGYGFPYAHCPDLTVDGLRMMDLSGGSTQEATNATLGYAHAQRISCMDVINVGGEPRLYTGDREGKIVAWARQTPGGAFIELGRLEGHARAVTCLVFTPSNGMLWSSSEDATIRIWNSGTNKCELVVHHENGGHTAAVVAMTLGKSAVEGALKDYVISGSKDGTMGVFQASDGALTYKHKVGEGVSALATFEPIAGTSALLLVGYEDGTIAVRNFPEFALAFELHPQTTHIGHTKPVRAFLPINNPSSDDSYFLSAGDEGTMIWWNVHKLTDSSTPPRA